VSEIAHAVRQEPEPVKMATGGTSVPCGNTIHAHSQDHQGAKNRLLAHLHRGGKWAYWWTLQDRKSHWWQVGKPSPLPSGDADTYFGVHPTACKKGAGSRATNADVVAVNCVFADFDVKDHGSKEMTLAHVEGLPVVPSALVDSGGGYHAYWLLREPFIIDSEEDRKRIKELQRRWVDYVGGDPGAKDLARVLRVPGTRNMKPVYAPNFPTVTIVQADLTLLYRVDGLEAAIPAQEDMALARVPHVTPRSNGPDHYAEAALVNELATLARAQTGDRNTQLNRSAFNMGQFVGAGWLERSRVEQALYAQARDIGLDERETNATIQSGMAAGIREPRKARGKQDQAHGEGQTRPRDQPRQQPASAGQATEHRAATFSVIHNTDLGNARRLVARHGTDIRYCHAWGAWFIWDGRRWAKDETGEIQRLARATVASIHEEASRQVSAELWRALEKWAMRSESRERLGAMVDVAGDEPGVYIRHTELNANPWLLNVMNGTLDLQTGKLRPHRREDAITKISPVVYDPGATCPLWLSFLRRILPDPALRAFIQRAAGYSLTGLTIEQCLLFLFGTGANGKTTLIETLMGLLADYAQKAPTEMLMTRPGGSIPNDIARLPGARLVVAAEIEAGRQMAESLVKDLTGGDTMVARFMRQEFFEFRPTHKLWMYGNHKPIIRGTDDGIWRRIHLVPFLVTIPEAEKDPGLVKKLNAELPGILKWAVDGCLAWQEKGLGIPGAVDQATGKYRAEMDVLGRFLGDCCHLEPRARVTKAALYEAYERWGGDLTKRKFGDALRERGFEDGRGSGNAAIWKGIGQLTDDSSANAVLR